MKYFYESPNKFTSQCVKHMMLQTHYFSIGTFQENQFKHDDVIKRKHFPHYWPFVRGIHRLIPRTKASDAELWCLFYVRLNKRLSKQSRRWWFDTPPCHYDVTLMNHSTEFLRQINPCLPRYRIFYIFNRSFDCPNIWFMCSQNTVNSLI